MKAAKIKKTFVMGLFITLVLVIIAYILTRVGGFLKKLIIPIAHQLGMENVLGEFTIIILAILAIIILIFVLGFISLLPSVSMYKDKMEDLLLKIYPPLSYLKVMEDENLKLEKARADWKPVLALMDDQYWPAFIIEENEEWVTLSVLYVPKSNPRKILIARKDSIQCIPMTTMQMLHHNRLYGKGHLSLIPSSSIK